MIHIFLNLKAKAGTAEVKTAVKEALGTEGKSREVLEGVLATCAAPVGYEGPYVLKFARDHARDPTHIGMLSRQLGLFIDMMIDEQRLSPEDFAKKIHELRMAQMREQMAAHQPAPSGPPMSAEEKAKIIEAAREAQRMMASMSPHQRTMLASAAQNHMASLSQENPGLSPQERSRLVSEKMGQLHKMIKEGGIDSPQLSEALRKLNVVVDAASQAAAGQPAAAAAAAPRPAPRPTDEDDDIGAPTTMDRS